MADTTDLAILRRTIARELETITQYERDAAEAVDPRIRTLLQHLASEEKEHVSEGMAVLELFDRRQAELNARGAHFLEGASPAPSARPEAAPASQEPEQPAAGPSPAEVMPATRPAQRLIEGMPTRVRRKMAEAMVQRGPAAGPEDATLARRGPAAPPEDTAIAQPEPLSATQPGQGPLRSGRPRPAEEPAEAPVAGPPAPAARTVGRPSDEGDHGPVPAVFPPDQTFTVGSLRRPGARRSPSPETFGIRRKHSS